VSYESAEKFIRDVFIAPFSLYFPLSPLSMSLCISLVGL